MSHFDTMKNEQWEGLEMDTEGATGFLFKGGNEWVLCVQEIVALHKGEASVSC